MPGQGRRGWLASIERAVRRAPLLESMQAVHERGRTPVGPAVDAENTTRAVRLVKSAVVSSVDDGRSVSRGLREPSVPGYLRDGYDRLEAVPTCDVPCFHRA